MPSSQELAGLALVATVALVCGVVLARLKQPAIVGYIAAGVILGPSGLGLVENRAQVALLAELGILMLLFLVGMKMSLRAFRTVYRLALLGALVPLGLSVALTLAAARVFGWSIELAVLLGFVISLSSTAVAIKMLEDIGELRSEVGRSAVGVLIVQDLAVVPMLLILNAMAGPEGIAYLHILPLAGAIGLLVLLVWYLGRAPRIRLPFTHWVRGDLDLVPLTALAFCFGAAAVSGALGLSAAYGAFLAGLFIGCTTARRRMIHSTQPIQSVLMMVFALSVGLLIDLQYIWHNLVTVAVLLLIVLFVKTAMNVGVLRLLGEPWPRAFLAGTVLGQVGEFSFVLASAGLASGLIDDEGGRLAVAVIALSLAVSPLWLDAARRLQRLAEAGVSGGDELLRNLYWEEAKLMLARSNAAARWAGSLAHALRAGAHAGLSPGPLDRSAPSLDPAQAQAANPPAVSREDAKAIGPDPREPLGDVERSAPSGDEPTGPEQSGQRKADASDEGNAP